MEMCFLLLSYVWSRIRAYNTQFHLSFYFGEDIINLKLEYILDIITAHTAFL